jgi:hypothetical protein
MLMRKYAANYAHGRPGARLFRTHVVTASNRAEFLKVVSQHFPHASGELG